MTGLKGTERRGDHRTINTSSESTAKPSKQSNSSTTTARRCELRSPGLCLLLRWSQHAHVSTGSASSLAHEEYELHCPWPLLTPMPPIPHPTAAGMDGPTQGSVSGLWTLVDGAPLTLIVTTGRIPCLN